MALQIKRKYSEMSAESIYTARNKGRLCPYIEIETQIHNLRPVFQRPPPPEESAEDYTYAALLQRKGYVDLISSRNVIPNPGHQRFAACYKYFFTRAWTPNLDPSFCDRTTMINVSRQRKLRACQQLLLFDRTTYREYHPCDLPPGPRIMAYLHCTIELLKYTLHARYQAYTSRHLASLHTVLGPSRKLLWHKVYTLCCIENAFEAGSDSMGGTIQPCEGSESMIRTLHQLNRLLNLRPSTTLTTAKNFVDYTQRGYGETSYANSQEQAVSTYQLENLVQAGYCLQLANLLYSDFVVLDNLMRFESKDVDIWHLQAIVIEMIRWFFNVRCSPGQYEHSLKEWQPTASFDRQKFLLRNGDRIFSPALTWSVRTKAEQADEFFRRAWTKLSCEEDDDQDVQGFLTRYLRSLGMEHVT